MFIGQTVKILPFAEYKYTIRQRAGQEGEIQKFDPADGSYWVHFGNQYDESEGAWYSPTEFESMQGNFEITTVGQAVDFLVKAGYKVTIEKE